ncbi:MAG: hypothetical protein HC923_08345 [Myxococcales bacterium]|nr:hypothetical protein [Myxococcales bacterium]
MIRFSWEQLRVFSEETERLLASSFAQVVVDRCAEEVAGTAPKLILLRTHAAIRAAKEHQLTSERGILVFVLLVFQIGPGFFRHPSIRRYLLDRYTADESHMTKIATEVPGEAWEEAARLRRPSDWAELEARAPKRS